jgi:signal transduction histidine kinase
MKKHPSIRTVVVPIATVGLAVLVTIVVVSVMGAGPRPLIAFSYLTAILVSAWYGGYTAGIISCLLCFALPLLVVPNYSFRPPEVTRFGLTIVISLLVSRIASIREKTEAALRTSNEQLERTVRERTEELAEERSRYQALANHLIKLQESERLHLSRELHDSLGQELTCIRYSLQQLGKSLSAEQAGAVQQVMETVGKLSGEVREISYRLRPPILEHFTLPEALEWLVSQWSGRTNISCSIHIGPDFPEVNDSIKLAVFRVSQEALTNIARHSQATHVSIALEHADRATLRIVDNGRGFDMNHRSRHLGLLGMHERAEGIGAHLDISSVPGTGTTIGLTLPPDRTLAAAQPESLE